MAAPAVVRDLREPWAPESSEELERFETGVPSAFVLGRASAGLADRTTLGAGRLDQIRTWLSQPLWDMEPAEADVYFGTTLRHSAGPVTGTEHVLHVPGTAAQGRNPPDARPGGRVPDRQDEPASRGQGRPAADPAE